MFWSVRVQAGGPVGASKAGHYYYGLQIYG
jgi:hypothetical protein